MLKKTVTYVDYDGETRIEDHYFNLNKAELTMMDMSHAGGMEKRLSRIINAKDGPAIMKAFEDILHKSYGRKSDDGRKFIKNEEIWEDFKQTEAFSQIFMELCTDSNAAAAFVKGILPADLANDADVQKALKGETPKKAE